MFIPDRLFRELELGAGILAVLIEGVSSEESRWKASPESWSILEVMCHLYDEEREDFRQRLDLILHRPTEAWPPIDPEGWVRQRNYNERDLEEIVRRFQSERRQSVIWLRGLAVANWDVTTPFGPIKAGDMLSAWVAHDIFHMRQLVKLRHARLLNLTRPYDIQYAGPWG